MTRRLDVINPEDPGARPRPAMPSACETGGCGGAEPAIPPPPSFGEVRVNGIEIPPEAIAAEIQYHPAPDAETAWIEAARALAIRELLLQEAARLGLSAAPESDPAGRVEADDDALTRLVLEHEIAPGAPSDEECHRYYEMNRNRFRTPELFEASHILIEPEHQTDDGWAAAERQARALAVQVADDPARFATAARTFSGCASAQQDGSLGQIRRGELAPQVQAGIEALEEGTTGREPVRSRFGWHILRLQRRIPGQTLPFEAVAAKISEMLEARSWSVAAGRYILDLAAAGQVEGVQIEREGGQ